MRDLLALRSRFAGTIQDILAGVTIVWFVVIALAYLEAL